MTVPRGVLYGIGLLVGGSLLPVARADMIYWENGNRWNGAVVEEVRTVSGAVQIRARYGTDQGWYEGVDRLVLTGTVPAASRAAAIRAVQRWQPGAHRPSLRRVLHTLHYETPAGADGVSGEVWVADRHVESLPAEQVYDVTATVYDDHEFSTQYTFVIDLVSGRLWPRNAPAHELVQRAATGADGSAVVREPSAGPTAARRPTVSVQRPSRPVVERPQPGPPSLVAPAVTEGAFIGNLGSRTLHRASCPSGKRIKDENKITFQSREDALAHGYTPCKRCNP